MAPECLEYLRDDEGLRTMLVTFSEAELKKQPKKVQDRMKVEEGQKCNVAGSHRGELLRKFERALCC